MKCPASTQSSRETTKGAKVICLSFPAGTHPTWDNVSWPSFSWAQPLGLALSSRRPRGGGGGISGTDTLLHPSHFPPQGARRSGTPQLRADARWGRGIGENGCSSWRRLHLDPQLRRHHLLSRSSPTRSPPRPPRPPRRAGASLAAPRERRRLPRAHPGARAYGLHLRLAAAGWLRLRSRSSCFPAYPSWIVYSQGRGRREACGGRLGSDAPLGAALLDRSWHPGPEERRLESGRAVESGGGVGELGGGRGVLGELGRAQSTEREPAVSALGSHIHTARQLCAPLYRERLSIRLASLQGSSLVFRRFWSSSRRVKPIFQLRFFL